LDRRNDLKDILPLSVSFLYLIVVFLNRIQDIGILFNLIIILLMLFNTYVFQIGLVAVLLERFRAALLLSALYLTFSIILHSWLMVRYRPAPRGHTLGLFFRRDFYLRESSAKML